MADLIDRQMAIDALHEQIEQCNRALSSFDISPKDEYAVKVERASLKAYRELLENLPPAQPDRDVIDDCLCHNLISREAAIEALARMMPRSYTPDGSHPADEEIFRVQEVFADCIEALEILPSAQPDLSGYSFRFWKSAYEIGKAEAQPEEDWTLCSKRLPEEHEWIGTKTFGTTISDEVYVTFESPKGERFTKHLSFQNGKVSSFTQREIDVFYKDAVPIAWMPLPEPYRGGNAE